MTNSILPARCQICVNSSNARPNFKSRPSIGENSIDWYATALRPVGFRLLTFSSRESLKRTIRDNPKQ